MMKRSRSDNRRLGPAAAAMRRRNVFCDARQADSQTTVSKIIADAAEMQQFHAPGKASSARVMVINQEELAMYRQKRRAELEERVTRGYKFLGNWIKYARWEAQQKDFSRMRAVLERAVAVHGDNPTLWRDYAELEQVNGFANHARLVWNRGVTALPCCTDLWLKLIIFEQATGQDQYVREGFNRWLSMEAPPSCAFELFALFEVQRQRADACRDILRRYVEATNTPEAWLFYGATEQHVLGAADRAVKVLQTAMAALPESIIFGPEDCRVPLALAEVYLAAGHPEQCRQLYHQLLERTQQPDILDEILTAYSRFERLYGNCESHAQLSHIQAKKMYQDRVSRDPSNFDARVCLYLLLREEIRRLQASKAPEGEIVEARERAFDCLEVAVRTPAKEPHSAQQQSVLIAEFARLAEAAGRVEEARAAFANGIKHFPFDQAACPRIWIEAAALEERQCDYAQARKLFLAASKVTGDVRIFEAALGLEERVHEAGNSSKEDYLHRVRHLYQEAIKAFPLDAQLWQRFARLEEGEAQYTRADALFAACIKMVTSAASATKSFVERYALLEVADATWGRRIALHNRLLKRFSSVEELAKRLQSLQSVFTLLLQDVWADYRSEAIAWKSKVEQNNEKGMLVAPPPRLPEVLEPATSRWSQAVDAVVRHVTQQFLPVALHEPALEASGSATRAARIQWMRDQFKKLIEQERALLRRTLGASATSSFDVTQRANQWTELLLSPLLNEWGKFETLHGGSLEAVREVVAGQPKRRTRLFRAKS